MHIERAYKHLGSPSSLRKRLWQFGLALLLVILTAAAVNPFLPPDKAVTRRSAGHDFLAFYTAGSFVRTGRSRELYDLAAVRTFQQRIVRAHQLDLRAGDVGPFWNPPLYAWLFAPLSTFGYERALDAWLGINLLCFIAAMVVLCGILKSQCSRAGAGGAAQCDWRTWALVPLLTMISIPFIEALGHGQNTCMSLLIVSLAIALWRRGRILPAGMVLGLLFYKPQLSCILAAAMVLTCGWRALAGLALAGAAVLAATWLTLPGTLADFLHKLPANLAYMQIDRPYLWDRHVTFKAFWRLLIQGFHVGADTPVTRVLTFGSIAILAGGLLAIWWKMRGQNDLAWHDRLIAITLICMPLLMPFYFDYDLLLLAISATLLAGEAIATRRAIGRWTIAAWAGLYLWMIINPVFAGATRINGTVIGLSILGSMMIWKALQRSRYETQLLAMGGLDHLRHRAGGGDLAADDAKEPCDRAGNAPAGGRAAALSPR